MATSQQILGTYILIGLYAVLILYFVIRGALKTTNLNDYAVGNVNFSPSFVGFSLAVSMTSAATFVINPGLIAVYGFSGVLSFGIFFSSQIWFMAAKNCDCILYLLVNISQLSV